VSPVMNVSDKIQVQLQPSMEMLHLYGQKKWQTIFGELLGCNVNSATQYFKPYILLLFPFFSKEPRIPYKMWNCNRCWKCPPTHSLQRKWFHNSSPYHSASNANSWGMQGIYCFTFGFSALHILLIWLLMYIHSNRTMLRP
jgi:hypothetical protein